MVGSWMGLVCFFKGDPLWVRTFRWKNSYWLLQLRKNINGRFIMLIHYTNLDRSRSIIFPEGPNIDGRFGIAKLLKKVLIEGHKSLSSKLQLTPRTFSSNVSSHLSFTEVVKDEDGDSKSLI